MRSSRTKQRQQQSEPVFGVLRNHSLDQAQDQRSDDHHDDEPRGKAGGNSEDRSRDAP
jgi:hypothetical protein